MTLDRFAPSVSVLTPTFNQARFLDRCIASVVAQSYAQWEQVILDDASTDDTADVVRAWRDPRIRYRRQAHAGILALADTYNRALASTDGELVAILEGDDYWAPDKLASLVSKFRDAGVVLAYGRTAIVVRDRPIARSIPDDVFIRRFGSSALFNEPTGAAALAMLETGIPFTFPCAVVVRRSALEAIGGFRSAAGLAATDYPTFLELALTGRFEYVDRIVAYWRRHGGSGSWSTHRQAMSAAYGAAKTFMAEHASELRIDPHRVGRIDRAWRQRIQRASFNSGRYLLLQRRWREARRQFAQAARSAYPPILMGGLVGLIASWLRTDIEGLMSTTGRVAFPADVARERSEHAGSLR